MLWRVPFIMVAFLITSGCFAQDILVGEVTFMTKSNVYVRFASTDGIALGDTLDLLRGEVGSPCLVVGSKSSTSCVCTVINGCVVEKLDRITFTKGDLPPKVPQGRGSYTELPLDGSRVEARDGKERVRGRLSAASYSTLASEREDDHRLMYRFSLDADHIKDSKFSAETYLNYRQLFPVAEGAGNLRTNFFSVYNLAVTYEPDTTMSLSLGRKINNNASSIGAIDGLQAEKYFGRYFAGAIAGFRPDQVTYGLNFDLLEYGGYLGFLMNDGHVNAKTTLGLLQQTNNGGVDRRYTYFQHSSTINGNLNLFSSVELDLYNKVNGATVSNARLTNLYLSARYRFSRKVDVFGSYDSRKRIIYYETYRNDVEMLLDDDDARQGARIRLNVKPSNTVSTGLSYSKRFESGGADLSNNINGYVTFSMDPTVGGRWNLQVNRNTSNYLRSDVISIRHSRTIIKRKLNGSLYYRMANYTYGAQGADEAMDRTYLQRYYGAELGYNIGPKLVFSMLGEVSTLGTERNFRMNASIAKRFDSKK